MYLLQCTMDDRHKLHKLVVILNCFCRIDDEISADDFFTGDGSPAAVHRLLAGNYKPHHMHLYINDYRSEEYGKIWR